MSLALVSEEPYSLERGLGNIGDGISIYIYRHDHSILLLSMPTLK